MPPFVLMSHAYVLFGRGGDLFAVRFDPATRTVAGEAMPVATAVSMDSLFSVLHASVSSTGVITYVPGSNRSIGRLAWVDRAGRSEFVPIPPRVYGVVNVAPAGNRAAIHVGDVTDYIWLYDFTRREGRRFAATHNAGWPVWTRDGESLTYSAWSLPRTRMGLAVQPTDRAGVARRIAADMPGEIISDSWSPDGRTLSVSVLAEDGLRRARSLAATGR